jgi:hypothetical protein
MKTVEKTRAGVKVNLSYAEVKALAAACRIRLEEIADTGQAEEVAHVKDLQENFAALAWLMEALKSTPGSTFTIPEKMVVM